MIEPKKKICSICGLPKILFRSNPPTCQSCVPKKKIIVKAQLKTRTPIKKSFTPIKQVSEKREQLYKKYKPLRSAFLKANPLCQLRLLNCTGKSQYIHHKKGKSSEELYLDEKFWMASCSNCNLDVESYPLAYEKGLKIHRNQI